MNILIIEDELQIRQTLQDVLEINGHTVMAAANGLEGVKLAERRPDLIFCDINMPVMDGYQAIAMIQQMPNCRDVPFIFLTALGERAAQRRGMALGADDYIVKPFTERDILDAISARIQRQQTLRERLQGVLSVHRGEVGAEWSHELMTPLNGILGGLALIEEEAETIKPAELRELLGLIRISAERQLSLAKKLVLYYDLERIKTSSSAKSSSCDAPSSIKAGADWAAQEEKRSSDLNMRCEPGILSLSGVHLVAAVTELVTNAFRFSKPGQPVTITGMRCQEHYRVDIVDQGIGMTSEQCANAIAFVQFDRSQHNQQGLGLGLAIARTAAEIYGGRLLLQPGPGSHGLQATLDLPCA